MIVVPTLRTGRLVLRPFVVADGPEVERLAGDREVARCLPTIPHPYPPGAAAEWIAKHPGRAERGEGFDLAVTLEDALIGAVGLTVHERHGSAELGYWLGRAWWGRGFATEAAAAVLAHGFEVLELQRIYAHHLARNPASGGVLAKVGMKREGTRRRHLRVHGELDDVVDYGLLREER